MNDDYPTDEWLDSGLDCICPNQGFIVLKDSELDPTYDPCEDSV